MTPLNAKISVVIPTYNHARFLPESIESALCQTLKPYEVIVVDDGSTDNTGEIVARYPVTYLCPPHGGLSAARNAGIRESGGDWIALLDADDYWLPEKLQLQIAAVGNGAFCYCATRMFFTDGRTEPRPFYDHGRVKNVLRHHNCIDPSSVLVRKDALVKIGGFNESMPAAEDWEAWLKLARVCDFVGIPQQLLMYRVTGSTSMGANPEIVLRSMNAVVEAGTADLPPLRRFIEARRMRSVRTALAAVKYRDRGDYANTLHYALRAFAHWPSPFYDRAFRVLMLELGRRLKGGK
jgi:glycosyltransferase involved in cell wall biosynthesis